MEERHTQEFVMVKNLSVNGDVENDCRISAHMQILLFGLTDADVAQRVAELETAVATVSADAEIRIDLQRIGEPYMGVVPNQTLTRVVEQAMADMQLDVLTDPDPLPFATDFGNISRRAPSALIGTGRQGGWQFHNLEGDREFRSSDGQHVMIVTAEVLARAITGVWEDPGIVVQARTDFEANISGASP
jgi:metal-dependent amidase/aminoacylase/carboxypeptidase family protein